MCSDVSTCHDADRSHYRVLQRIRRADPQAFLRAERNVVASMRETLPEMRASDADAEMLTAMTGQDTRQALLVRLGAVLVPIASHAAAS